MNKTIKRKKNSFILSIVLLLVGMSVGFILLSFVYTGPTYVRLIVFLIYLFILITTLKFSSIYIKELNNIDKKENEDK